MVFAHDTERALEAAAGLVNTLGEVDPRADELTTLDQLGAFVERWRWTGAHARDEEELAQVRALRPRLRTLWALVEAGATDHEDEVVALVNALLAENRALPQLIRHEDFPYHLHATPQEAPLAVRMAVEAAMAMVDVVRQGELDRLRICAADDCRDVLVDLSKNRSRRFCDSACANRTHVSAFRARRAGR